MRWVKLNKIYKGFIVKYSMDETDGGFMEEDEEVLSEEEKKQLKEKLEYFGYI